MDLLSKIIELLVEGQRTLPSVVLRLFTFTLFIFILDYSTGVSKSIHESYKIEHLTDIVKLVQTDSTGIIPQSVSSDMILNVSNRTHYSHKLNPFIPSIKWDIFIENDTLREDQNYVIVEDSKIATEPETNNDIHASDSRSFVWMLLSSNWLTLLLLILIPFAATQAKQPFWVGVAATLFIWITLAIWAYFTKKLYYFIPIFFESNIISYILNFIISSAILGFLGLLGASLDENKESANKLNQVP